MLAGGAAILELHKVDERIQVTDSDAGEIGSTQEYREAIATGRNKFICGNRVQCGIRQDRRAIAQSQRSDA